MRDLIVTENISVDGVIDLSRGWFDPQTQGDSDHSDLMAVLTEQGRGRGRVPDRAGDVRAAAWLLAAPDR